jgi:hypothetical protein
MISGSLGKESELHGLPLQFVAKFIAEDDAHPGRDDVVCALGFRTLTIRPLWPESKSFDRLTGNLKCNQPITTTGQ